MNKLNSRKSILACALLLLAAGAARAQAPEPTQTPSPQAQTTPSPSPAQTTPSPQSPQPAGSYAALVERAKKGDAGVDFRALRMAFYETDNYNPIAPMMTYRSLWGAIQQQDWAGAIKLAESVLEKNFVEVNAHMVAYIAHRQSGNEERAGFHRAIAEGLLNSIKASGDGKTTATAFEVISTSEEYGLFRSMNLSPVRQSLLEDKGSTFDAIETVDPRTNARATFYFKVDKPLRWNDRKRKQ
ncbi:MAG TPA: DUF4919 domain-containing protein [Pyrinomonadaceae bacterium]|nr:DUF4919 domain-containing protein [Pyrinomonadaceae bacterium]